MDIIIVMLAIMGIGFTRYYFMGANMDEEETMVMNSDGSITSSTGLAPIGNNLECLKEPEAYSLILKQFKLR